MGDVHRYVVSLMVGGLVLLSAAALEASRAAAADYPPKDRRYHSYPEMAAHIADVEAAHPDIIRIFSIGESYQGRRIWAAEVSDQVGVDEDEPEVLFDGLHHAREHLSAEMAIAILDWLAGRYGGSTALAKRITKLVDTRRIWIVFMVNPDGLAFDISGGSYGGGHYRAWRKNRQPTPGVRAIGTDLNRNWGYAWGCCGGSSGAPASDFYRGPARWSAPEVRAFRDFVRSRVVDGRQRIATHISFHSAGEMVLWPFGHTYRDVPPDMTRLDHRAFVAIGRSMAASNGYRAMQSSSMYPTDGDQIDWLYGRERVFSYTFELYPRGGGTGARYYPPDEVIGRETRRNRAAILYLIGKAGCPYAALGADARREWCGPFFDDLEIARGWRVDPDGTDTATDGGWRRGDPKGGGGQLGSAASGRAVLVTGPAVGHDVDGGRTTVRSPVFRVPTTGQPTLKLRYWVALGGAATAHDGFAVHLVDGGGSRVATLLEITGADGPASAGWTTLRAPIPDQLAGQDVAIELEAVDAGGPARVEAAVDQVRITG
jgi:hypothetical protein